MKSGFVVVEGVDKIGKTTLVKKLMKEFPDAVFVSEPGTTKLGRSLRRILKYGQDPLDSCTQILLFMASFVETTAKVIKPALEKGKLVIADRWFDSTVAYQIWPSPPFERELLKKIFTEVLFSGGVAMPDLQVIMTAPVEVVMERRKNNIDDRDNFEKKDFSYTMRVMEYYADHCFGGVPLDASGSRDEVFQGFLNILAMR